MDDLPLIVAILRFGRAKYLKQNIEGRIRFVPPEYYRMRYEHPSGDSSESCSASYRRSRGRWDPVITIAGHKLTGEDLISFTLRGTSEPDRYLHCWTILSIPKDSNALEGLKADLCRVRDELGPDYLALPHTRIDEYAESISSARDTEIRPRIVCYSEDPREWCPTCKNSVFRYQREFRFLADECDEHDEIPIEIATGDLSDVLELNPPVEFRYKGELVLRIDETKIS